MTYTFDDYKYDQRMDFIDPFGWGYRRRDSYIEKYNKATQRYKDVYWKLHDTFNLSKKRLAKWGFPEPKPPLAV